MSGKRTQAKDAVLRFVEAIHRADPGKMRPLLSEDHVFVDSDGSRIEGREAVLGAWEAFFSQVGDYRLEFDGVFEAGDAVVLVGAASGICAGGIGPGRAWRVPAAWRAVVKDGWVTRWQVFVNPEPIREALAAGN
jgi:ketosteroid isomerase-like protein